MYRDTDKFTGLLKPHYNDAVNYCTGLCYRQSPDEAKDLLQDSLLKALENIESLNETEKFRSWLFTIITREFYNSRRKYFWKRFISSDSIPMPDIFSEKDNTRDENRQIILKALTYLKPKERSSVLLYELGGFSINEICDMENEKSLSAVKSRLSRAREKLRKVITNLENNSRTGVKVNSNQIGDLENETIEIIAGLKAEK